MNAVKPIRLTQVVKVLYEVDYTREDALDLLKEAGHEWLDLTDNASIAERLAQIANQSGGGNGLYERLVDDAGDWKDTVDVDDWKGVAV